MDVTRRGFLEALGTGAAAATLPLPLAGSALAAAKSDSIGQHVRTDVLLNSNENAYGPSPRVLKALRDGVSEAHRYPDKARKELPEKIAKLHHVSADQVLLGCGSVEILRVASQAFTGPGRKLMMASPTFEVPGRFSEALGAEVVRVPLNREFAHDLPAMLAAAGNDTGLVYLCNPNNPTASITPRREIEALIAKLPAQTFVLVDEAYHHFATDSQDYVSFLDRPASSDRVLVARTFSKVYGLAGMRLGYGIGSLPLVERMRKLASPENGNIAVMLAAMVALDDHPGTMESVRRNAAVRDDFMRQARQRKLAPIACHANFAMMDVSRPVSGVIDYFKKQGILVGRAFPPLDTHLRVSFGRPPEMVEFWRAFDRLPARTG